MIHPDCKLTLINPTKGYGVVATEFIPKGTITWTADELDIHIKPDSPLLIDPRYRSIIIKYAHIDPNGMRVMCWDIARYINHSCSSNTLSSGFGFEIAVQDIEPGEEITDDYGMLNIAFTLDCVCGEPTCRGQIGKDDFAVYAPMWETKVNDAMEHLGNVSQPLFPYLDPSTLKWLQDFIHAKRTGISISPPSIWKMKHS